VQNNPVIKIEPAWFMQAQDIRRYHMGTLAVSAVVIGVVALIIRSMIRDKKNGKSIQCGGQCKDCGGHCH